MIDGDNWHPKDTHMVAEIKHTHGNTRQYDNVGRENFASPIGR